MKKETGRLKESLDDRVAEILFGDSVDSDIENHLKYSVQVDKAHIIMLMEQEIISKENGIKLLEEILSLEESKFKALRGKKAPSGWYLLYEEELIKKLGSKVGGSLHTGRSRNDLYATIFRLKLRAPFFETVRLALDLRSTLLDLSKKHKDTLIPIHTQMQPAYPSTFGHYLLGIDKALGRDIEHLIHAFGEVERCPLGAGAVSGTSFPIGPERTAELLGFLGAKNNSIDSVACYNYNLQLLSALSIIGVTVSRLMTDLQLWTTKEYDYFKLPDRLKEISSMMPQKDNPFILEDIKGKAVSNLGYLTSAIAIMQKIPFTNAIEVKKHASPQIWDSMKRMNEVLELTIIIIKGLTPNKNIMVKHKLYEFMAATAFAEFLVRKKEYSFREAHETVGEIINEAISSEKTFKEIIKKRLGDILDKNELEETLNFSNIVKIMAYGGGPGGDSFTTSYKASKKNQADQVDFIKDKETRWRFSEKKLSKLVTKYIEG